MTLNEILDSQYQVRNGGMYSMPVASFRIYSDAIEFAKTSSAADTKTWSACNVFDRSSIEFRAGVELPGEDNS